MSWCNVFSDNQKPKVNAERKRCPESITSECADEATVFKAQLPGVPARKILATQLTIPKIGAIGAVNSGNAIFLLHENPSRISHPVAMPPRHVHSCHYNIKFYLTLGSFWGAAGIFT